MSTLNYLAILFFLTAISGFINNRYLRLPSTIGIMLVALLLSIFLLGIEHFVTPFIGNVFFTTLLKQIDFPSLLLKQALAFLLFAGSLHVNLEKLWKARYHIAALAILGTVFSVFLLATLFWILFSFSKHSLSYPWCLVLGAILAPTDPVSVINMLHRLNLPKQIQAIFAGESLFNDGVAVVLFTILLEIALNHSGSYSSHTFLLIFIKEILGSSLLGAVISFFFIQVMKNIKDNELFILFSLALATGVFSIADILHLSGPIAVVISGLFMGNLIQKNIKKFNQSFIINFWKIIDEILNTMLFLLIGLEIFVIPFYLSSFLITLLAIPFIVLSRFLSTAITGFYLLRKDSNPLGMLSILTWGGLRGGISLAMALSLPIVTSKNEILIVTYSVTIFTILVQGLTMERVIRHFYKQ